MDDNESGTRTEAAGQPRQVERRSIIRWIGGATVGAAAALSGKFDILGTSGGGKARVQGVAPEDSGFERWGDMLLVPSDAAPVEIEFLMPPSPPPAKMRTERETYYDSVASAAQESGVTMFQLRDESPKYQTVTWRPDGHPDQVRAILSQREIADPDEFKQADFRQYTLSAQAAVGIPYPVMAPPTKANAALTDELPTLQRVTFQGVRALATPFADGVVVQWVKDHTYYVLDAREPAHPVTLAYLNENIVPVQPA